MTLRMRPANHAPNAPDVCTCTKHAAEHLAAMSLSPSVIAESCAHTDCWNSLFECETTMVRNEEVKNMWPANTPSKMPGTRRGFAHKSCNKKA